MSRLQSMLAEASAPFADKRIHFCELIAQETNNVILLTGTVLDEETITAVSNHLHNNLPNQTINSEQVKRLCQKSASIVQINTPITTLYDHPGFLSEPATQLLNGQVVELLQEDGKWAFVRQMDGYLGWVYRHYLTNSVDQERDHWVCVPVGLLRQTGDENAPLVSRVLGGTAVSIQTKQKEWVKITLIGGISGWLPITELRPQNRQSQNADFLRAQMVTDAYKLTGVPYLWGGSSAYGLDCSGFAQWVYRLSGVVLPRDADMQMENGRIVAPPYKPGDLFFFGELGAHRRVSHVGISLGGWQMIHASRSKNGVYVDDVQAVDHLRESFLGARTYVAK